MYGTASEALVDGADGTRARPVLWAAIEKGRFGCSPGVCVPASNPGNRMTVVGSGFAPVTAEGGYAARSRHTSRDDLSCSLAAASEVAVRHNPTFADGRFRVSESRHRPTAAHVKGQLSRCLRRRLWFLAAC